VNEHRFLDRLARGDLRNVRFTELCRLVKTLLRLVERYNLTLEGDR
jgi:hypothetical protein